ncbi:MAG: 3-deoxy-D-manno-octulosonic acid transferase [Planctomycetia bacterium]|nr:3-deoxy-D-manno-octulosonic acid transferase [Planctomycetia bacterium]
MSCLLNLLYLLFLILASPILLYRIVFLGKYREGFREKWLGSAPILPPSNGKRIWFHAVSVGEMNLLKPILREIDKTHPDWECVISATSKTGMELGKKIFSNHTVFYCPLDFSWSVRRAIKRIKPDLLVLVELELWPNLILTAHKKGIKTAIVNGRISDRSFRRYRKIRFFTRLLLKKVDCVAVQDSFAANYFQALGANRAVQTGSIKFDGVQTDRTNPGTTSLARLAGLDPSEIVFLAGSTQDPEEAYAISCFRSLRDRFKNLRLILVPRHTERFESVAALLRDSGLPWARRSEFETKGTPPKDAILLIDTIGELGGWWGTAKIAFVGGSMGSRGGQNMLEPAAYGAAVSFGPNTKNFRDISSLLLQEKGAIVVHDEKEMCSFVEKCITDKEYATLLGKNAQLLVLRNAGATKLTISLLQETLSPSV